MDNPSLQLIRLEIAVRQIALTLPTEVATYIQELLDGTHDEILLQKRMTADNATRT